MEKKIIVMASGNNGKIKEAQEILKDYKIISIKEIGINIERSKLKEIRKAANGKGYFTIFYIKQD